MFQPHNQEQYQGLSHWYHHNPGEWLLALEQKELNKTLSQMPGQHILQIGGTPSLMTYADHHLCFHYFLDAVPVEYHMAIRSQLDELPLLPNSLNSIVISHALEFCEHPALLFQNCYEALVPGGNLIIFCFNKWSFWGMLKWFKRRDMAPWTGQFFSLSRLKTQLEMQDFEIKMGKSFCFHWPRIKMPKKGWNNFVESVGQTVVGNWGAINFIVANKKMMAPLTQKAKAWKVKGIPRASIAEPTTRSKL